MNKLTFTTFALATVTPAIAATEDNNATIPLNLSLLSLCQFLQLCIFAETNSHCYENTIHP